MRVALTLLIVVYLVGIGGCKKKITDAGDQEAPYDRTVLLELFTNVYCINCDPADAFVDSITGTNARVVAVLYHDPAYNPGDPFSGSPAAEEIEQRNNFYFGQGTHAYPYGIFDGILMNEGFTPESWEGWSNQIDSRLQNNSQIQITLSGEIDTTQRLVSLRVTIDGKEGLTGTLFIALTESELPYNNKIYNHVLRRFVPDASGTSIIIPEDTTFNVNLGGFPDWKTENMAFVVFVQDEDGREVLQSARIPFSELRQASTTPEYSFTLLINDTLFENDTIVVDTFYIVNTGYQPDSYAVEIESYFPDSMGQVFISLCRMDGMCLPVPIDTTTVVQPGDSTGYTVDFFLHNNPGVGYSWIKVNSLGNPSVMDSIRVTIRISGGS